MDNWIEVNSKALQNNYKIFQSLSLTSLIAPVLKSNAYGHGLQQCFEALEPLNPEWLCVNYLSEAQSLRDLGFVKRILLVGPLFEEEGLKLAANLNVDVLLFSIEQLRLWCSLPKKPKAHLELETGLNRLGFCKEQLSEVSELVEDKKQIAGVGMHFANVEDVQDDDYANLQFSRFEAYVELLEDQGFEFALKHASASAPFLLFAEARLDMCRLGISLYGLWPSNQTRLSFLAKSNKLPDLQPVLSWKTQIAQIKEVRKGESIGYGCTFKATYNMKIAVLPLGYNEGYSRRMGEDASYVLVRGQRAPVVGRICMNMFMVDVSHVKNVQLNDTVVLLGRDKDETLSAEQLASWSKTIHYELLTRLHGDINRRIIS